MSNVSDESRTEVQPPDSTIERENQNADLDSKMKATWEANIGIPGRRSLCHEIAVLLLSWDHRVDDLKTAEEVEQLRIQLEVTLGYKTIKGLIHERQRPSPQAQVNRHLANFVADYDDPNTVLIVYYYCQGRPGKPKDGLNLAARQEKPDCSSHDEIICNQTEHNARHAESDVLFIVDCCYAGYADQLKKNLRSGDQRAYKYLGTARIWTMKDLVGTEETFTTALIWAMKDLVETEETFTTALIWAMKDLVETEETFTTALIQAMKDLVETEEIFTTQRLTNTIINKAHNFPEDQYPRLSDSVPSSPSRVTMLPLDIDKRLKSPSNEPQEDEKLTTDVNLRFIFNTPSITETIISKLAKEISNCLKVNELKDSTVVWEGLNKSYNVCTWDWDGISSAREKSRHPASEVDVYTSVTGGS